MSYEIRLRNGNLHGNEIKSLLKEIFLMNFCDWKFEDTEVTFLKTYLNKGLGFETLEVNGYDLKSLLEKNNRCRIGY